MAETLASEIRINGQQKRTIIVLFVVIVILLLLWLRYGLRPQNVTNNITNEKLGDLLTQPQYINFDVPGIDVPSFGGNGPPWDWMQTTDCACDCSTPPWVPQTPADIIVTQYAYLGAPALAPVAPINFPVYQSPPLPTWWMEPGYNVHHEQAMYVYTSDGVTGIRGKYSRSGWNDPMKRGSYPQQTKNVTLQGDDAYIDGRHYKHNPNKDKTWPPSYSVPSVSFGAAG